MNKAFLILLLIFGFGGVKLFAQTDKPTTAVKSTISVTAKPANPTLQSKVPQLPAGKHLTPKVIQFGGSTIPGDSAVLANLTQRNLLDTTYNSDVKNLNDACQATFGKLQQDFLPKDLNYQNAIQKSFEQLKKENGWGEDVIMFSGADNVITYIKLSPEAFKAMQDAGKKGPEKVKPEVKPALQP